MRDCVFCKIVADELPSHKVYEDSEFMAFLDIMPYTKGHVLVIPKKHYRWVWDVPNTGKYFTVGKTVARALQKAFNKELIITLTFGEQVPHAHIHILPGNNNFMKKLIGIPREELPDKKMEQIAEKIRSSLPH